MEELAKTYIGGSADREDTVTAAASLLQYEKCKILDLIEALESSLTNPDTSVRASACQMVSSVLLKLPIESLTSSELTAVAKFLCCRLQDHYTLQPSVLDGFLWASFCPHLSEECAKVLLQSIFKDIHTQSCLQGDRYKVYNILINMLDNQQEAIGSLGKDFAYGFIQAVDGEQDPKNLMLVFQLAAGIIQHGCDLSGLVEEFFEVISCYFPIDFNPGKNSPITNKDLVEGLRSVLSSTHLFAKFCIPLLLEKMESDLESAKLDSIITLSACLQKYFRSDLVSYVSTVWNAVKQEIMHSVSQEVEKQGLALVTQLVKNMSEWPLDEDDSSVVSMKSFLTEVLDDCIVHLKEPMQDKVKWMSSLIVQACAQASPDACVHVVNAVMPCLLQQVDLLQASGSKTGNTVPLISVNMQNLADAMLSLMSICKSFTFINNPFASFKENLFSVLMSLLRQPGSVTLRCTATSALAVFLSLDVMTKEMLEDLAVVFLEMSLSKDVELEVRSEILLASSYLASKHSQVVKQFAVPKLQQIVDESIDVAKDCISLKMALDCLAVLSTHIDTLQIIVPHLMKAIQRLKIGESPDDYLLECLRCFQTISKSCSSGHSDTDFLALNVCLPLIRLCVLASLEPSAPGLCCSSCNSTSAGFSDECTSLPIFKSAAVIVKNICQKLRPGGTADFVVNFITELFLDSDISAFELSLSNPNPFEPLNPNMYPLQTRTVCFLIASVCAFDRSIIIAKATQFKDKLLDLCLQCTDQPTYVFAAKALSGLVNKAETVSDSILNKVIEYKDNISNQLTTTTSSGKMQYVTLLVWLTKALTQRNHPSTLEFVKLLFSYFGDADVGEMAAGGVGIILWESDEVLNQASHAIIKLMYKQRFFLLALSDVVDGFHAAGEPQVGAGDAQPEKNNRKRANYLTALSQILIHLPKQVLSQKFSSLLPLLMQSLRSNTPSLLDAVLSALLCLIQDAPDALEPHADMLAEDFLQLSQFKSDMNVRLKAVTCVGAMTLLPSTSLLPFKNRVIRDLAVVVDDPKRSVRTEAAKARSAWCLVGT